MHGTAMANRFKGDWNAYLTAVEGPDLGRKTRIAAVPAMRKHGIVDYRKLLEGL